MSDVVRPRSRLLRRAAAMTLAGVAVLALVLNTSASEGVYVEVAGWTSDAPPWVHHAVELVSEGGLVLLAATWAGIALAHWRSRRRRPVVAATGAAVVVAYALSELLKLVHDQPRPCATVTAVRAVAECPGAGDWSLPSNHATIAAALGTAVVLLAPRLWAAVLAVVLAVGLSRVALGLHYPHDVLDGLSVGSGVVALVGFGAGLASRAASRRSARASTQPAGDLLAAMLRDRSPVGRSKATLECGYPADAPEATSVSTRGRCRPDSAFGRSTPRAQPDGVDDALEPCLLVPTTDVVAQRRVV